MEEGAGAEHAASLQNNEGLSCRRKGGDCRVASLLAMTISDGTVEWELGLGLWATATAGVAANLFGGGRVFFFLGFGCRWRVVISLRVRGRGLCPMVRRVLRLGGVSESEGE